MNGNFRSFQTLTDDLIQQQNHLKDAVNYAVHEETDMFIVSKDKEFLPCQKSLLSLFSPDIAYLLSEVPSCASPTIFLSDFLASHIKSLLHILRTGQTLLSEDFSVKVIHTLANVLNIQINTISRGHYLNTPLKIEEVKVEQVEVEQVVQAKNQIKEVEVKKENIEKYVKKGNIKEYVEEEIDKIIKQENNDDLVIDKVRNDMVRLQTFVDKDRKVEDDISSGYNKIDSDIKEEIYSKSSCRKNFITIKDDKRVQEVNKVRLRPISNLVKNEHEENWYEKDDISPRAKIRKISHQVQKISPAAFTQNKNSSCFNEKQSSMTPYQKMAVDASNSTCSTVSPSFVQTSTPPTTLSSPQTVRDQVTTKIMYPCAQCGKDFYDSKSLTIHTRNHHESYMCTKPGCHKKTVGYYERAQHVKKNHVFACKCGQNFTKKKRLTNHKKICLLLQDVISSIRAPGVTTKGSMDFKV